MLVVRDPHDLAGAVRDRYPQFDLSVSPDYLRGIAALAHAPARTVLVGVDPAHRKFSEAVAGLKKAAGKTSRLILCCTPLGEPAAREALTCGADDYLIYPPSWQELDVALGVKASPDMDRIEPADRLPAWDELHQLAEVLAALGNHRTATLDQLCRLLAETLRSPYVCLYDGRNVGCVGDPQTQPAADRGHRLGRPHVRTRSWSAHRLRTPFSTGEVEKLRHYSRLIAHLIRRGRAAAALAIAGDDR